MWADPKFKEVSYNELQEGDLVFYGRPWSGRVCHVAIYIGGNECIEALNGDVEMLPLGKEDDDYTIVGYKRVIADG
jgi:cell wall-associated NlpC family hydrolase